MMMFQRRTGPKYRPCWMQMLSLIFKILFKTEDTNMDVIYATLIINGSKTFAQVPERIKPRVKQVLIDLEFGELAE